MQFGLISPEEKKVAVGQRRIAKRNACGELNSAEFDKKASLVIGRALKMEKKIAIANVLTTSSTLIL